MEPRQATETGRLRETLARFETFLDRHLTNEEDLVVPILPTDAPSIG